ncbi:MAG: class I adenylate cyclase [Gammaproteobacteria bacterium]|nr:class I adenylate cyclase [Gammaproteobacteria bacterium]
MTTAKDNGEQVNRKGLLEARRRFSAVHKERLRRIEWELQPPQRDFITLLPLLFHISHAMLPGFVGSDTPAGIPDFSPTPLMLRVAKRLSRSFEYKKQVNLKPEIQGLYLMGSIGSIAHTAGSDFDLWLCREPGIPSGPLESLRAKALKIEEWASELGLELHVFIIDADAFRQGERDELSYESSGSTQRGVLLEEFYRTGVLLAGRFPLWWLVPPEEEANYTGYSEMLLRKRFVNPRDCIDFGGLEGLPADEFFGAAHWQLFKGIASPYKAILKLLLVEAFAQDYPRIRWLCQEAKATVYSGRVNMNDLDPYVLMYRRVEQYLIERKEPQRLELARRCFYFKVERPLSASVAGRRKGWQWELLEDITREWRWSDQELAILDARENWKIDRVLHERNTLVQELTHSYRLLTDFTRTYGSSGNIRPDELGLLGRKLHTALEKRPGKIDIINPGISRNLIESRISLHYAPTPGGEPGWFLFLGDIDEEQANVASPVRTTSGLVEMLTWCHFNRVLDWTSVVSLFPEDCPVNKQELQEILGVLRTVYPQGAGVETPIEQFSGPAFAMTSTLFLNIGTDPMAYLSRLGKQLTSNRSDPLSFGAFHTNLVMKIEQLITNSWGETRVVCRQGTRGLLEALCHHLRLVLMNESGREIPDVTAHCFSSVRSGGIAKRIAELFNSICRSFSRQGMGLDSRYLLQVENSYYLVQRKQDTFVYDALEAMDDLLALLAQTQQRYHGLAIDPLILQDSPLKAVYAQNKPKVIQIFYYDNRGMTEIYVLDEQGALFHQLMEVVDERYLLLQLQRFIDGIRLTRSLLADEPSDHLLLDVPEFYRLSRDRDGGFHVEPHKPTRQRLPDNYLDVRLIGESLDLRQTPYILVCGSREFSSHEHGDQVFSAAARYILSQRCSLQPYPIYLTGLDLSGVPGESPFSTIELFNFKHQLEDLLNQALKAQQP